MLGCIHDLNKEENTLEICKERFMVSPEQIGCICTICKKVLKFTKEDNGKFKRIRKIF